MTASLPTEVQMLALAGGGLGAVGELVGHAAGAGRPGAKSRAICAEAARYPAGPGRIAFFREL